MFHQQAGGNSLEHIVHRFSYSRLVGHRLSDQIGEARALLALGITRGAANDLYNFGQARTVADGQRMLAPDPIKAFLCHTQCDDHIHVVAVVLLRGVFQCAEHLGAPGWVAVIH
ncbi:hypothetical protein D3C87_1322830 [compost metagenome]